MFICSEQRLEGEDDADVFGIPMPIKDDAGEDIDPGQEALEAKDAGENEVDNAEIGTPAGEATEEANTVEDNTTEENVETP